jgi:purine-cytosine permease-like protein
MIFIKNISVKMATIKYLFKFLDTTFAVFIGVNFIDFFSQDTSTLDNSFNAVDDKIKIIMAVAGTFYYVVNGIHKYHMNKKLEEELDMKEWENDNKRSERSNMKVAK